MNERVIEVDALPPMRFQEAADLARTEYLRFAELVETLADPEWERPTECAPWDVRLLVAHVLGSVEANASPPEMLRQMRHGLRGLTVDVDPVSAAQVAPRRHLGPAELTTRLRAAIPAAVRWRSRWSRLAGALPVRIGAPLHETWRLRYLMDVIYTRDVWMHRVDVCRATGRDVTMRAGHDGRIVAGVVAEWARRHGKPFTLVLGGPAGGRFVRGNAGPQLDLDAVEFCRILSGRGTGEGLLATQVPF
ncbi:maleylpyruvate isomerase family mycothiol-dependent enzyme [Pseudonocardia hispaniensis]|uniref:Maleylpyruvate isomerase family mycothiol-dependent enzyme n=1 Tax=Pseudonocardia hispaniensis TaxID=904933 RepID=A0ABW1J3J2_9PSEU